MSTRKKIGIIIGILVLIGGVLLTIFIVQQQQETRSRAQEEQLTISFDPESQEKQIGEITRVDIYYETSSSVTATEFVLGFDPTILELISFTPDQSVFDNIITNDIDNQNGTLSFMGVNVALTPKTGRNLIGRMEFKPKKEGAGNISFRSHQTGILGVDSVVNVDPAPVALITVPSSTQPTAPTDTSTPTITITGEYHGCDSAQNPTAWIRWTPPSGVTPASYSLQSNENDGTNYVADIPATSTDFVFVPHPGRRQYRIVARSSDGTPIAVSDWSVILTADECERIKAEEGNAQ